MRFFLGVLAFLAFDLVSKYSAVQYLQKPVVLIDNFLTLQLSYNEQLAFSIPFPKLAIIVLSLALLGGLGIYFYYSLPLDKLNFWAGVLIFAGAIANLIERVVFGKVVDFIDFSFWPSFNFADFFICIGAFLLLFSSFKKDKKSGII